MFCLSDISGAEPKQSAQKPNSKTLIMFCEATTNPLSMVH